MRENRRNFLKVDQIIKKRFSDGQLDQCDLTLADLTKIREAFVKNLVGMAHPRIQYRKDDEEGGEKKEESDVVATRPEPTEKKEVPYVDDAFGGLGVEEEKLKQKGNPRGSEG